jgi:hypothetical protein
MIEEAAYFRAEARDFEGGDPVADWLLSEQEIDDLLSQTPHGVSAEYPGAQLAPTVVCARLRDSRNRAAAVIA